MVRPRVAVVDDDPLSSALQSHLAALLGYDATEQSGARQVIADVLLDRYDVMLLDLGMPGMDGFAVLAHLREREAALGRRPLPVIAVTGYASDVDRLRCLMAGFTDHLGKPIHATALGAALARAVGAAVNPIDAPARPAPTAPAETDADRLRAAVRRLARSRSEEHSFVPSVTESFAMRSQQLIEAARLALASHDAAGLVQQARTLRASGEFLGATRFGAMCAALENDAQHARWQAAAGRIETLDCEHQAMLTLLFETRP
jgi:CheY-like chemotaxis protein